MRKPYGDPPVDLGLLDLSPVEMMCWMYCPIKEPGQYGEEIPANLRQFQPMVEAVFGDLEKLSGSHLRWLDSYVYITAKTLWVSPENPGNRPGWHSDGFMTDDLNYVWSDRNGTEFWVPATRTFFTQDHHASLAEMEAMAAIGPWRTYPDKHLLRLDEKVIHRVARQEPGFRTFVKISVSTDRYNLLGNSINHDLPRWSYVPRGVERNHTSGETK